MSAPSFTFAASWAQRRYSYAAVLALTALSLAFPAQTGTLLGIPLAVGMVVLGVAHGACDQLIVPASQPAISLRDWRYWLRFLSGYLGLAAIVGVFWWYWPAATVGGFFLLTIWHWGSADAPSSTQTTPSWWLLHSLLRGLLLFVVPMWWQHTETANIVNQLLIFAGAAAVDGPTLEHLGAGGTLLVAGGHLLLWAHYARRGQWEVVQTEVVEMLVLLVLLLTVPPRLSVAIYFVFWHSLQHVLRLNSWLGYEDSGKGKSRSLDLLRQLAFFLRRAMPLLLVSSVALLLLGHLLADRLPDAAAWFSLALIVASIVTLPHALLVTFVMDASQWPRLRWSE